MKRSASLGLLLLAAWPQCVAAQDQPLGPKETQGQALFAQHCVVCHFRTQLNSPGQWGPPLSKATLGGDESIIREYITDGTPRMPGFKYNFRAEQIEAIAAFIKTLPVQSAPQAAPAAPTMRQEED